MEGDKKQGNEVPEEQKGEQIDTSGPMTTDQKIKQLEAKLPNVKFTFEDKEKLRDIFDNAGEALSE